MVFVFVRIFSVVLLLFVDGARVRTFPARLGVVPTFVGVIFVSSTSNGFTNVFRSFLAVFLRITNFLPRLYVACSHASYGYGEYGVAELFCVFVVLAVTCDGMLYYFYEGLGFCALWRCPSTLYGGLHERGYYLFSSLGGVLVYVELLVGFGGFVVWVYYLSLTPNCRTLRPRGYAIRPTPRVSFYVISVARLYPYVLVSKWSTFYFCEDYQHSRQGGASPSSQGYMISNIIRVRTRDVYVNMSRVGS